MTSYKIEDSREYNNIRKHFDTSKQKCQNVIVSIYWQTIVPPFCIPHFTITFDIILPRKFDFINNLKTILTLNRFVIAFQLLGNFTCWQTITCWFFDYLVKRVYFPCSKGGISLLECIKAWVKLSSPNIVDSFDYLFMSILAKTSGRANI